MEFSEQNVMRRIFIIVLTLSVLVTLTACKKESMPKDDGRRFDTAQEAILTEKGGDLPSYVFEIQDEKVVFVMTSNSSYTLYKDELGYFPLYNTGLLSASKSISTVSNKVKYLGFLYSENIDNRNFVELQLTYIDFKEELEIYDSIGSEIIGKVVEDKGNHVAMYYAELPSEIPEDYRIYINGVEHELPTWIPNWLPVIGSYSVILLIVGIVLLIINYNKIRRYFYLRKRKKFLDKMHKAESEIFGD